MSSLNISFEETRTVSKSIESCSDEFTELLGKIKNSNEQLRNYWNGADAESYTNKISEQAQVMDKLSDALYEIAKYIGNVAVTYEEVMQGNKVE